MDASLNRWPLTDVYAAVRGAPRAAAVVAADRVLSYAALWDRIGHWAEQMSALGTPPGSVVGLLADEPAAVPEAWLGARAAGLVPLLLDPGLQPDDLAHVLAAARPAAVADLARGLLRPRADPRIVEPGAGYVVFSSGTQGVRKGIVGSDRGLRNFVEWEIDVLGLRSRPHRAALLTSPSFDVILREFLPVLCSGGQLHVPGPTVAARRARTVPWLAQQEIDVLHAVPGLAARWADAASEGALPRLRWTLFAGEPLYDAHLRGWRAVAPGTEILNLYGPSETTLATFSHRVGPDPVPGLQPVGRPLPGASMRRLPLRTDAASQAVEAVSPDPGEPFEIEISTPYGSLGYLEGAAGSSGRLRRADGVTTFSTGDRGRLDSEGRLVVEGRLDSLVKRHGRFVDCARIEQAARGLPGVSAACCVQVRSDGSGDLVLFVEDRSARQDEQTPTRGLRRALVPRLGADLPDRIVPIPALPLLPNGKVDRRDLLRRAQHGALAV